MILGAVISGSSQGSRNSVGITNGRSEILGRLTKSQKSRNIPTVQRRPMIDKRKETVEDHPAGSKDRGQLRKILAATRSVILGDTKSGVEVTWI